MIEGIIVHHLNVKERPYQVQDVLLLLHRQLGLALGGDVAEDENDADKQTCLISNG